MSEVLIADPFQPISGISPKAWRVLIYGGPGVGKSSWAAMAPEALFLDLENGLDRVDCNKTPTKLQTLEQVVDWLRWFVKSSVYTTVIIDTVDELEKMLAAKVVEEYNRDNKKVKTVADIPYGRGGDLLVAEWRGFLQKLEYVHNAGKNVILVGHEQVIKFENPTDANYDFYTVNIHKKAAPVVAAKLDAVFFAHYETAVRGAKDGKGKATTTGERILETQQGASWIAKNRFGLEGTVPMNANVFEQMK